MDFWFENGGRGRLTLSSAGWLLLIFSVFYLASIRYFHYASSRDPSSYFFDSAHAYNRIYSAKRVSEAESFIAAATQNVASPGPTTSEPPRMCIGVATVARRGEQYVQLTIGSLLAGLNASERKEIYLNLLIGHTDPSKHPLISEPWIKTLPNKVLKYDPDSPDQLQIQAWEEGGWYRNKTIYDYTYLLKDCHESGADYIAIFEDDTLAMAGWYARAKQSLSEVEAAMARRSRAEKWIYLRLFYSDDLLGWNSEEWPRYLFWSVMVWVATTAALLAAKSRFRRSFDSHLTNNTVIGLSTTGVALTVILHFMAGRHTTHPISPGIHEMNKYGCCSQGLVFPRSIVPDLLKYTDLTTDWLVDMMIEKIADQQGWVRWATVPSLLQHIGGTSSKGYGFDDNAKKLWNFRFEDRKV